MNQGDINSYPVLVGRNKTMREKIIGLFIIVLMITTVLPASGTSEKRPKENSSMNYNWFIVVFGLVIIDAVLTSFGPGEYLPVFVFTPVKKVTFIGYGFYYPGDNTYFHILTFTNVSRIDGFTLRPFHVSQNYQHIIMFPNRGYSACILYLGLP